MKYEQLPRRILSILEKFCGPERMDEVAGDILEEYNTRLSIVGPFRARLHMLLNTFRFAFMYGIKQGVFPRLDSRLLGSHLRISWRVISRHKMFTAINVAGLALSLSVALLIISLLSDVARFDRFHEKRDRIGRVVSTVYDPTRSVDDKATAPLPLAEKLRNHAGVEQVIRMQRGFFDDVLISDAAFPVEGNFVDAGFFDVFSFRPVHGNLSAALQAPGSVVLTRSTAMRLFRTDDVVGRELALKSFGSFQVTGVVEDPPKYSHLQFEVLGSFSSLEALERDGKVSPTLHRWDRSFRNYIYLLFEEGFDPSGMQETLDRESAIAYPNEGEYHAEFKVQSLLGIVPGPDLSTQIGPKMMYLPLLILSTLGLVVLISACFNYTNLSIARSLKRAKEVGLRKICGARRWEITSQFLTESVILAILSGILALGIFVFIRPHFLQNAPMLMRLADLQLSWLTVVLFFTFTILVGAMAGSLPATLISHVGILQALKQLKSVRLVGRTGLRNGLVIFQFTLSLFLITGVGIIYRQYQFSLNRDLGFEKDNLYAVHLQGVDKSRFTTAISNQQGVESVSFASLLPGTEGMQNALVITNEGQDSTYVNTMSSDAAFISNLRLKFIAGQNFPDSLGNRVNSFALVNRQFLSLLGIQNPRDAIGRAIGTEGGDLQIIGVLEDFNYVNLEEPIRPFLVTMKPEAFRVAVVLVKSPDIKQLISTLEASWNEISGGVPMAARFYDEEIQETYSFYVRLMHVFGFVGLLALLIAVLGLLGMATYTTETRRKEIGIRKVMGAGEYQVVMLLSRGFLTVLSISGCIALPAVYLLFDQVILGFTAYHISIGFLEMSGGLFILLIVGWGTIASQTLRAARVNPVETLRAE